jgi:hypothetical protein
MSAVDAGPGLIRGCVIQIVDDQNMIVKVDFSYYHPAYGEHEIVWISQCSTMNHAVGTYIAGCFALDRRPPSKSMAGKSAFRVFRPFNLGDYLMRK